MTKPHLPISAHARLNQLRRLKELWDSKDGLSAAQRDAAAVIFSHRGRGGLNRLRGQAIGEMVASGYLSEEIFMTLADPESPYSILIEGLGNVHDTVRAIIREAKEGREKRGQEAARDEYIQRLHRLIDATWVTLDGVGAAHHKSLLDAIDGWNRAIAEAEGIRLVRAGRGSTKQSVEPEKQSEKDEEDAPAGEDGDDPKWEEAFHADEDHD